MFLPKTKIKYNVALIIQLFLYKINEIYCPALTLVYKKINCKFVEHDLAYNDK